MTRSRRGKKLTRSATAILAIALLLGACSGGGHGGAVPPASTGTTCVWDSTMWDSCTFDS